jgi:hypothetical protein
MTAPTLDLADLEGRLNLLAALGTEQAGRTIAALLTVLREMADEHGPAADEAYALYLAVALARVTARIGADEQHALMIALAGGGFDGVRTRLTEVMR